MYIVQKFCIIKHPRNVVLNFNSDGESLNLFIHTNKQTNKQTLKTV